MYKIIMIDDEPWALKGIRNIIDWESYGFTDIQTFGNPIEALEAIQKHCPDVVCTDVLMPGLSGLELIERCREMDVHPLFIVISAYAEFEYAKRALDGGAFSYILKPLEEDQIAELAEKLQSALRQDQMDRSAESIRTLVMQALTSERTVRFDSYIEQSGIFSNPYQICMTDSVTATVNAPWFRIYDDLVLAVLPGEGAASIPTLCGFSQTAQSEEEVCQRIWEALVCYYTLRFYGKKTGSAVYHECNNYIMKEADKIVSAVYAGNLLHARALLDSMQMQAVEQQFMIDDMTYFYNNILQGIFIRYPNKEVQETLQAFDSCFQMYSIMQTEEAMFKSLRVLIDDSIQAFIDVEDVSDASMLAVRYADTHYTEMINLELLSEQFHVSISHLSRQFKRITGVPFTEYIMKKRIAHACELLRYTKLPVKAVGIRSGYPDYFHFNKVFKKVVGVSPLAYRKEGRDDAHS